MSEQANPEQSDSPEVNREAWDYLREASELMNPGGGSLETSAACQALFDICCEQQHLIDDLERRCRS